MTANVDDIRQLPARIMQEVSKVIIGKQELKEALLVALLAGGHVLIEGLPGTAKTKLAETFAIVIGGKFKRVQLTPDMMPSDITGFYMYSSDGGSRFLPGPIFGNVVLADELNRTTPKTQSALLESMGEGQVTIEGVTHDLPRPFMVIATQLEAGAEGTYPLTDVQLDRFLVRDLSRYPKREEEKLVLSQIDYLDQPSLSEIASAGDIEQLQKLTKQVYVAEPVLEYLLDIVEALRKDPDLAQGPGPRGSIAFYKCCRARALLEARDYVIPDDVKRMAKLVMIHRLHVKPEAEMDGLTPPLVLDKVLSQVAVPRVEA